MGPNERAGKKVNAPTIRTVPTRRPEKSGPDTGKLPLVAAARFLRPRLPASASAGMIMMKRPTSIAMPMVVLYQYVLAVRPAKALPLLPVPEEIGVQHLAEAVGPGVVQPGSTPLAHRRPAREPQDAEGGGHDEKDADLHVVGFDLLAEVLGRLADHQARQEHRQHHKISMP